MINQLRGPPRAKDTSLLGGVVLFQDIEDRVSQDMQDRCRPAWLSW